MLAISEFAHYADLGAVLLRVSRNSCRKSIKTARVSGLSFALATEITSKKPVTSAIN